MSVIVKGMEMPKNCTNCPLNYDQMACKVTGTRWWSDTMVLMNFDSDKERLYDCPLLEANESLFNTDNVKKFLRENPPKGET